MKKEVRCA